MKEDKIETDANSQEIEALMEIIESKKLSVEERLDLIYKCLFIGFYSKTAKYANDYYFLTEVLN